eukprot:CAMPEP_0194510384 /NCGR_PEP_ID=MMETSP0253-20130528/41696_1 /TAXON_ID=2966 /ORGANISM="Noctiluca scintillans" /LENGTH=169 /DNA_ID=CAMNT_0039353613 /DNA_START=143 /DNA_END=649 /DNA_ORIENTATION=+
MEAMMEEVRSAPEAMFSLLSEGETNRTSLEEAELVVQACRVQPECLQHVVGAFSDSLPVMSVGSCERGPGFVQRHSLKTLKRLVSPGTGTRGGRPPSSGSCETNFSGTVKSNSTGAIKARVRDTSSQSHPQVGSLLEPRETASEPAGVLKRQAVAASVGEEQMLVDEAN